MYNHKNVKREKGELGRIAFIKINNLTKASGYVALCQCSQSRVTVRSQRCQRHRRHYIPPILIQPMGFWSDFSTEFTLKRENHLNLHLVNLVINMATFII